VRRSKDPQEYGATVGFLARNLTALQNEPDYLVWPWLRCRGLPLSDPKRRAGAVGHRRIRLDAKTTIFKLLANAIYLDTLNIEDNAIVERDSADFRERFHHFVRVIIPKFEEIDAESSQYSEPKHSWKGNPDRPSPSFTQKEILKGGNCLR
jgi:hypothetical protein